MSAPVTDDRIETIRRTLVLYAGGSAPAVVVGRDIVEELPGLLAELLARRAEQCGPATATPALDGPDDRDPLPWRVTGAGRSIDDADEGLVADNVYPDTARWIVTLANAFARGRENGAPAFPAPAFPLPAAPVPRCDERHPESRAVRCLFRPGHTGPHAWTDGIERVVQWDAAATPECGAVHPGMPRIACDRSPGHIGEHEHDTGGAHYRWNGAWVPSMVTPETPHDAVNHPRHYTSHASGVEAITVCEHMSFCIGNAIKYLWRADHKGAAVEDFKKAIWYIEREITRRAKLAAKVEPYSG